MFKPKTGQRQSKGGRLIACVLVALGALGAAPAHAELDLLKLPAVQAPKAAKALTLDLTSRGNHVIAVGERGVIISREVGGQEPPGAVKDDQGNWWKQAQVPVSVNLTGVAFASDKVAFAVGHDGVILKSEDAGASWNLVFDGDNSNEQVVKAAQAKYQAFEASVEAARNSMPESPTPDQEAAMEELETKLEDELFALEDAEAGARFGPTRPMLGVWFKDESTGWVVGSYGQFFETVDGGQTWTLVSGRLGNPGYRHLNGIYGDETGLLLIAGEGGRVYKSEDFGQTWEAFDTGYIGHFYGTAVMRNAEGQINVLAYGFGGNIYRLGAGAHKWWKLKSPTDKSIVGAVVTDQGVILIDQLGRLMKTDQAETRVEMVDPKEGLSVTGMTRVGDELIISAQGGPRSLAVPR